MSECLKVHNSKDRSLDLQITELVNTVTGRSGKNLVVPDLTTGVRYALTVTLMRDDAGALIYDEGGKTVPQLKIEELA